MTTIEYKFSEGDYVTVIANEDMGEMEVNGLHCLGGTLSYTINNGVEEFIKYEYQLELAKAKKIHIRKVGFMGEGKSAKVSVNNIGETRGIEIHEEL